MSAIDSTDEATLVAEIRNSKNSDEIVETTLKTDEDIIDRRKLYAIVSAYTERH